MLAQLALIPSDDAQLALYDAMCTAIAAAYQVDEVQTIRDKARVYEAAAKIAGNTEAEDRCYQIRRRAERRLGQIMAEQKATVGLAKGGAETGVGRRGNAGPSATRIDTPPTLAEAGIDKHLADDARKLASVPEEQFETAFSGGGRPSVAEITGKPKPAERSGDSTMALWLWGRVLDFERNGTLRADPATCLRAMEDFQIEDVRRVGPHVVAWLNQFLALATEGEAQ